MASIPKTTTTGLKTPNCYLLIPLHTENTPHDQASLAWLCHSPHPPNCSKAAPKPVAIFAKYLSTTKVDKCTPPVLKTCGALQCMPCWRMTTPLHHSKILPGCLLNLLLAWSMALGSWAHHHTHLGNMLTQTNWVFGSIFWICDKFSTRREVKWMTGQCTKSF